MGGYFGHCKMLFWSVNCLRFKAGMKIAIAESYYACIVVDFYHLIRKMAA
jgi:hypothetical protein